MAELNNTIEVVVPRQAQNGSPNGPRPRRLRVEDALQFTPMTTSVLPAHDRIPIPQLSRSTDFRLTTAAERQSAYRPEYFTRLAKERLAALLDPACLSEIKFKRSPVQNAVSSKPNLNPISKMILKSTPVQYTHTAATRGPRTSSTKPKSSPKSTKSQPPSGTIMVEIPRPPSSFQRNDYATMPGSPKRRKLSGSDADRRVEASIKSKRQKDDRALMELESHLVGIFEAQDALAPDTSAGPTGEPTGEHNTIFESPGDDDNDAAEPRLALSVHKSLHNLLAQLVDSDRLGDASAEYLSRLQRLCEPAIEAAQSVNLRLPSDPSGEDISIWRAKIQKAENGAASACTLIYTVLGAGHYENLVNLEVLQWLPNVLVNLFENCLIAVVESRPEGQDRTLFELAVATGDLLKRLLNIGRKLLDLVDRVCVQTNGAGSMVNATEFLAAKLMFVQNAYSDKLSALGSQTYERVRKQAMATLSKLYAVFPAERGAILDEVLTSLDKLPSTSRSARQFKLGSGKSIQLISALFMQLVQTPAMQTRKNLGLKQSHLERNRSEEPASSEDERSAASPDGAPNGPAGETPLMQLSRISNALLDDAFKSAQQIVGWMVDKASKVTKSGDSPYRNILDLFVEDLTVVLPSREWPASELLLTVLALRMITLAKNDKAASTKNMALESLGTMGSAISVTRVAARSLLSATARPEDATFSSVGQDLANLAQDRANFLLSDRELISSDGPFAMVLAHLFSKEEDTLRIKSARAYFLVQYATLMARTLGGHQDEDDDEPPDAGLSFTMASLIRQLSDPSAYFEVGDGLQNVTAQDAQLAYLMSILNGRFCRRFPDIAKTLASSLSSDQAQVRSRSLKSVVTILETDSSLLDWDATIAEDVFRCASDDSSLVRDSALSLIAKFIMPRPALEEKAFRRLLKCAGDANVGVQKRAMGHLRDIYLKESRENMKATIAIEFLRRTADLESSVAELARKTLAEVWISPQLTALPSANESAQVEVAVGALKNHIVACINHDASGLAPLLKDFLSWKLKEAKNADAVQNLYARIVKMLLETANGSEADSADLTTLVAFAEARPQTVVPGDLTSLKSYLKDLSKSDNLLKFKSVVAIFRCVLPQLSSTQASLLQEVQLDLMKSAQHLARRQELEEVMSCLRSIDGVLHNTGRIVKYTISIMHNVIQPTVSPQLKEKLTRAGQGAEIQSRENRMRESSLRLVGTVAKHIDLESYRRQFQAEFPTYKSGSVAGFIVDSIVPFTFKGVSIEIRLKALESLGLICQAWPGQFNKPHVRETFFQVLDGGSFTSVSAADVLRMQLMVLGIFEELYSIRASLKDEAHQAETEAEVQALKNIGGDSKTREDESAVSVITNPLVDHLLRIVMSETGEKAVVATQTLASIDHQGMTHPKQSTAAFVALETSTDARVASVARIAHEHLHQQHESVCEREYMHAVHEAFRYQHEVLKDPRGGVVPGFKAKLAPAFAIISGSGAKYVKKFLSGLVSRLHIDFSKVEADEDEVPEPLLFVLFVTQNLAFFEYKRMEELLHTVAQLELAFGKNGGETAQAIEHTLGTATVEPVELAAPADPADDADPDVAASVAVTIADSGRDLAPAVDATTLKRLATAACAITLISEARNYLKRQYGISRDVKMAMQQQKQTKDAAKEPVRVHGITGDRFWSSTNAVLASMGDRAAMMTRCREFITLVAVDDEVKIADDENDGVSSLHPSPEKSWGAARGKKRKSVNGSIGGTPKRPRGRPSRTPNGRRSSSMSSLDDPDGDFTG